MKTRILLVLSMFFGLMAYGQKIEISKGITTTMPKGAQRIDTSKISADKNSTIKKISNPGLIYEINNLLIHLKSAKGEMEKDHLVKLMKGRKESIGWANPTYYETFLKSYPSFESMIICCEFKGEPQGQYSFHCLNKAGDEIVGGTIEYPIGDRDKAKKAADEILSSLKFN